MKNTSKNSFLEDLLTTILEIIEDKPLYTIPIGVYCILIEIYHHQNAGYFLSTFEAKPMTDEKMAYVAHINEVAPGTFLCYFKANNYITLLVFTLFNLIMYFYYSYLFLITYAKRHHQNLIEKNKKTITSINRALNSFFTLFWWIFFTPYIEINSGTLVTGSNSFLTWSRDGMGDTSYADKPKALIILGSIGLVLTIMTCLIIIFFFRNYEFHETNMLKRRYNTILIGLAFSRFFLIFFYYLNFPIVAKVKHFIAQAIGIFAIYDYIMFFPFKNKAVSQFYGASTWFYYVIVIIANLWMFTDVFPPVEHFYFFFIVGCVGSGLIIQIQNYQADVLMKIESGNFGTYFRKFDYFLEELMRLAQNSTKSETEKYQVLQIMAYHRQKCDDAECICSETTFVDFKNDIDIDKISQFIINRFKWAINSNIIQRDNDEFEHLSLKYISFLAKYKNNPPRAYNELKSLTSKRKTISIYFRTLSNILSRTIEFIMKQVYVRVQSEMNQKMKMNEELEISELLIVDEFKDDMIFFMRDYCQKKISFWQKLRQGFPSFEELKRYTSVISQYGIEIQEKYNIGLQNFQEFYFKKRINHAQIKNNCLFYKLKTLFSLLVSNEISSAFKDQAILKDLLKREDQNRTDILTNSNLISGNIDYIIISISKDRGKLLQKASERLSRFFDYSLQDFVAISQIKQLMPPYLSRIHNLLIENMLTRGYSSCISQVITSFGYSKYVNIISLLSSRIYQIIFKNQGFIFPMNVYLNHVYGYNDDFTMHGTILKVQNQNQYLLFDNQGQMLGITFDLFMKIIDENNNEEDFEYGLHKMDSSQKTQLQQKTKQFMDRVNVQFILPQISNLIHTFSSQIDKSQLKNQSMKSHLLANGHHIRLKMPCKLYELVQNFKRKAFNFSRSIKSYKSTVSQSNLNTNEKENIDLLNHINTETYTDFISQNRDYYLGESCLNDYDLKVQLHYNQYVYGDNFQESYSYFQISVLEINKIKEKSNNLHMNTLYPKTMYSTNQFNSTTVPNWIQNNQSPNACAQDQKQEDSNHGFPVNIFNKIPNQVLNDSFLQSQKMEFPLNNQMNLINLIGDHQPEVELDRTHNVDNSKNFILESDTKLNEALQGIGKIGLGFNQNCSVTDRQNDFNNQMSLSNKNNTSHLNIFESERPFQQKPNNDPYLNPKPQLNGNQDIDDIISPTQMSVLDASNPNNTNRDNDQSMAENSMQHINGFRFNHQESVKEREDTLPDQQENNQINPYLSLTAPHEMKKSIWEKHSHQQENQEVVEKESLEEIFGAKDQGAVQQQNQDKENQQINSYKSLSESEQINQRYALQRQFTNSKQSTKSKIKTKEDNKNSVASSQQSIKFDNEIIKDMMNTKRMPRAFSKFLILSQLFPPVLITMSSLFVVMVVTNYNSSTSELKSISNVQLLSSSYARSAMSQLGLQLMDADQFTPSFISAEFTQFYTSDLLAAQLKFQTQLTGFSDSINNQQDSQIIGNTNLYNALIFSDNQVNEIQLSYPQFMQLSYNFITSFIYTPASAKTKINSFQFLTDNFKLNIDLHSQLLTSSYDSLNNHLTVIQSLFISIFAVQLVSTLLFLVLQIPQIINLHKYQEKVFLLVTRIYDLETLKEITKLSSILDYLKNSQQVWMKVDFSKLATKEINLNLDQKRQGKQIVLSSQIFEQKIKPWKSLTLILMIFIMAQVYFGASVIVISSQQSIIKQSFAVNQICQQTNLAMDSFIFSTEILVFEQIIRQKYPDFRAINRENFLLLQQSAQVQMSQFTSNLQNTLEKFSIFDSSTQQKVNVLVQNDICSVLVCPEELKNEYTNGIIGLIQQYFNLISSQDFLTESVQTPTNVQQMLTYLELREHKNIMLYAFSIPLQSMEQLISYFTTGNQDAIQTVILFVQIYIFTVGFLMIILAFVVNRYLKRQFKKQITEVNFLLTFIPHEKMTEEATIHILKSLSNCY